MGIFEKLFPKEAVAEATGGYLGTITGYQPVFYSFSGGIYESELCRSAIHTFATHCSKLKPVVSGARKDLQKSLEYMPNPWMDTSKFLYKTATILEVENNVFIVPIFDQYYQRIIGFYPVNPSQAEVREKNGKQYIVFKFVNGKTGAMDFDKVGIVNKFFYKNDYFGENNNVLKETLDLMTTQRQGIEEGIKSSASIRFLGRLSQSLKSSDIEAEQKRWKATNLGIGNNGGIALFDTKYADVKQVDSKPYIVSSAQMDAIKGNVFDFFNCSENILRNTENTEGWSAYYEGKIEPFAIQLSLVLTNMLYTAEQKTRGNQIQFTANRLQYIKPSEKLSIVTSLSDRGMMSRNEGREVFNLEPIEGGDDFIIRGEYWNASDKVSEDGADGNEVSSNEEEQEENNE